MMFVLIAALLVTLLLGGSFVVVFRKLAQQGRDWALEEEWIEDASGERYSPMRRLLDAAELDALQSHPGLSRRLVRQFRSHRIQLFRGYLRSLSRDHGRICSAIRALMAHSTQDRPDLARVLIRQRLSFTFHFMTAHLRLTLHGVGVGTADAGKLLAGLDCMRAELNSLLAAAQPAAVCMLR